MSVGRWPRLLVGPALPTRRSWLAWQAADVSDFPPLGGYGEFNRSTGGPFSWGEGARSTVAYGVDVLPDLVRGLRELPALARSGMPRKAEARAAVLGCVYRLTSPEVIEALLPIESCVIVDRQQRQREPLEHLHREGMPLSTLHFSELQWVATPEADGSAPTVGPYSGQPDPVVIGPVRAAGWLTGPKVRSRPLVHVKMLVAGRTWVWENEFGQEDFLFTPLRTWMGSANWTSFAPLHLEIGLWSDDKALLARNQAFLLGAVRFSQPLDSTTAGPEPELVDVTFDEAAMAEAYWESRGGGAWLDDDEDDE
jgi:hypothetical protein